MSNITNENSHLKQIIFHLTQFSKLRLILFFQTSIRQTKKHAINDLMSKHVKGFCETEGINFEKIQRMY